MIIYTIHTSPICVYECVYKKTKNIWKWLGMFLLCFGGKCTQIQTDTHMLSDMTDRLPSFKTEQKC